MIITKNKVIAGIVSVSVSVLFLISAGLSSSVHAQGNTVTSPTTVVTTPNATVGAGATTPPNTTAGGGPANPPNATVGSTGSNSSVFYLRNPLSAQYSTVGGIVQGFLEILSYLVVLFAVLMLVWTGLQFILAQGNTERMKELKNQLLYIVIGVAIVIGARIIVSVVIKTLETTGVASQGVIQNARNAVGGLQPTP